MLGRGSLFARQALANFIRSHHGGQPGENLPFQITNRFRLTAMFVLFFSSGFSLPFLMVRHQLLKH